MKTIKIFMLAVCTALFAACSSDDEEYNSLQTTVGFQNETIVIKENTGIYNVPIIIEGYRNGDVSLVVEAEGTGANPAKEGVNFRITDKTLSLLAVNDTTNNAVLNVELETIDDAEINDSRELTLTITTATGATVKTKQTVVTLRDNDAAFYEKFFGKWTLIAKNSDDARIEKTITISGPTDESDPDYDKYLWVSAPGLFNVGVSLNCEWPMEYVFDKETKSGSLSFLCNTNYIATYGDAYQWVWLTDDGTSLTDDPVTAPWQLGEGDSMPTTIKWDESQTLYLYQPGAGYWDLLYDISITKQ